MRHKIIKAIRTRIYNRQMHVIIEFDNPQDCVFISPEQIRQNTSLDPIELELLIGSTMRIEYYKKGERMFNGKVCEKDEVLLKEYFFELQKPVEKLRIENSNQLLPFKTIREIFFYFRNEKEYVGIKTKDNKTIFVTLKQLETQSNLKKQEFWILEGSFINPEYLKIGEKLSNGTTITTDNTILKWLNLRFAGKIEEMGDWVAAYHERYSGGYNGGHDDYDGWADLGRQEEENMDRETGGSWRWNVD